MSMPEGAQLSDDGQWWWDGEQWQAVETSGGGTGAATGTASFDFDSSGLRIDAESSPVPSAGEPLKAAFGVCNMGTAGGQAHVTLMIDGQDTGVTWDSPWLEPGQCAAPDGDGYVHGLPAQSAGSHTFDSSATPAGPFGGKATNTIDVGS
jgi:hypothetical protein